VLLHILAVVGLFSIPPGIFQAREAPHVIADLGEPTKLIAPPDELTQKEPNRGTPSKVFDLEGLLPRPRLESPPSEPSTTRPAARFPSPPSIALREAPVLPQPPAISGSPSELAYPPLVAGNTAAPPPPQIQPEEKPKLAFEKPGSSSGAERGQLLGRIAPPSSSISEVGRELARGANPGGLIIGDLGEGVGGLGEGLNLPPSPGAVGSTLELLSDPMGIDFRPYLITILSIVRRNWYAVMPQSAKLGRRGRVAIQFAINRDGSIPKLVIASPSGTQALDRAAVAGISASNPFPPLPSAFRGMNIRLQFVFLYNMH
jgi:TonB family protein